MSTEHSSCQATQPADLVVVAVLKTGNCTVDGERWLGQRADRFESVVRSEAA
jgi:hypothetical protein